MEIQDYEPTEETPTFGVVADGRTHPAVVARRRQQNGSKRETIFTVSKNGKHADLYDEFHANIIIPYFKRKRERENSGGDIRVNTPGSVGGGDGHKGNTSGAGGFGFPT